MAAATGSSSSALRAAAIAFLLLAGVSYGALADEDPFGLTESLSGNFSSRGFAADWINGTAFFYNRDGEMVIRDLPTNTSRVVVPKDIMDEYQPDSTTLSADGRFVLFSYDAVKVYRHSSEARFAIFNIADKTTTEICEERLQLASWSPVGNALAYVLENNIYYMDNATSNDIPITTDGVPGVIYNGAADWVNEEEVLGTDAALWWSPDGSRLAFARYDDTLVHELSYLHYGTPGALEDQYPTVVNIRYPKAGSPNPTVQLHVATLPVNESADVRLEQMVVPTNVTGEDYILYSVQWAGSNELLAIWSNRVSNVQQFVLYKSTDSNGTMKQGWSMTDTEPDGWLEPPTVRFRAGDASAFVQIVSWAQASGDAFPQLVAVTMNAQIDSTVQLTRGEFTVTDIYGWAPNRTVYYQATEVNQPSHRQVYAVEEGSNPRCLSCYMTTPEGNACRWASAVFSRDFSWYALTCSGPDPTVVWLVYAGEPDEKIVWENNWEVRQKLLTKRQSQPLDDWIEVADGFRAQVRMWLPPDLDPKGTESRPAIVNVYAGPGSQQITDSFGVNIRQYFTTSRRYIYIHIDGRGSCCKGERTLFAVNRNLGSVEIHDQINVTRQLIEKYRFIDGVRTAIWGWSYGGYATAMSLAQDDDNVFQCGASVAPVSSWIYYDSIYTERYMGLPTPYNNEFGYNKSDVTRLAAKFVNKTYLLIHGTGDDNVHYQQSMALARALEEAGVLFRQQSYPDQDHSIGDLLTHVYRTLDEFFMECFEKQILAVSSAQKITGGLLNVPDIARNMMGHGRGTTS